VSQEVAFCLLLHVCIKYVNNQSTKQLRHQTLFCKYYTEIIAEFYVSIVGMFNVVYSLYFQYKEAFLKANPDFKWYKLPAPPLRTLVTRPSNQNKPHKLECQLTCGPITPGKLAGE